MEFDFDRAWRDTTQLFAANRPVLLAIAGIFFFLPDAAILLALPHMADMPAPDADFAKVMEVVQGFYSRYWWVFALLLVTLVYGTLTMLALLKLRARPTVGEALGIAAKSLPSYLAALVISALAIDLAMIVAALLAALLGVPALALVIFVAALGAQLYVYVRLAMTAPAIVLEGRWNPVEALRRSWRMTRGIGGRLLVFFALVAIAFLVSTLVASLVVGLAIALLGEAAAGLANAVLSAGIVAVAFTLFACVLAASYGQLARRGANED